MPEIAQLAFDLDVAEQERPRSEPHPRTGARFKLSARGSEPEAAVNLPNGEFDPKSDITGLIDDARTDWS